MELRESTISKRTNKTKSFVIVFFLVYFNLSSLAVSTRINNSLYAVISLSFFLVVFFMELVKYRKLRINVWLLNITIVSCILILSNVIITQDSNVLNYVILVQILSAFLVCCVITFDEFVYNYINVIFFISIYSLIFMYIVSPLLPAIANLFPVRVNPIGETVRDFIFSFKFISPSLAIRNTGVFREMGVFQIYVNLALTFKLFFVRDRTDYLKIIVFVVTILTTFSTPGIFHLTLILIAFAADSMNKKHINRLIKTATVLFFIMAIVILINQQVLTLVESSINKLVTQGTSYQIRLASIIGNLKAWIEKPFFGHGIDNGIQRALDLHLRQFSMHNTSTTTSFLAIYGFPFVIVVTAPMLLLFRKIDSKTISKCLLLVGLFTSIESQRLIYDQFLYVLYFSYFMRQKTLRIDDGLDRVSGSRKEMSNV